MTELLYFPDKEYQKGFDARVIKPREEPKVDYDGYICLDKTLFYKEGGGQPADQGTISWNGKTAEVVDVQKEHGEIRHYVQTEEFPETDQNIRGEVNCERRYNHMRMHTAQHVVSKVVLDMYNGSTAGNQIYEDYSRIDFKPVEFDWDDVEKIQNAANSIIREELKVEKKELPREQVEEMIESGRTNLDLIPESVDPLRVVIIGDDDICPCGGTHVDNVREIGEIEIVDLVSKGENVERLEFKLE